MKGTWCWRRQPHRTSIFHVCALRGKRSECRSCAGYNSSGITESLVRDRTGSGSRPYRAYSLPLPVMPRPYGRWLLKLPAILRLHGHMWCDETITDVTSEIASLNPPIYSMFARTPCLVPPQWRAVSKCLPFPRPHMPINGARDIRRGF